MSKLHREGLLECTGKRHGRPCAAEFPPPASLRVVDTQFRCEVVLEKRVRFQEKHEKEVAG